MNDLIKIAAALSIGPFTPSHSLAKPIDMSGQWPVDTIECGYNGHNLIPEWDPELDEICF